MKARPLPIMAAVWLGVICLGILMIPLAGCDRDVDAVHATRDAQGNTQVTVDGQKVDQNVKAAGDQIKDGANQAGAAIQRGADKLQTQVETKVVPAAKEMLNDANITATVKTKLAGDPAINALYVNVDTSHGQVTLSGKVALAEQKVEAEKVARKVEGVKDVVNQIQVAGTPQ